jgi:hypothetical protein
MARIHNNDRKTVAKKKKEIHCNNFAIFISLLLSTIAVLVMIVMNQLDVNYGTLDILSITPAVQNKPNDINNKNSITATATSNAHHCINEDFHPQNKVGVWTMLNDNMDYVKGAAKLGIGVRAKTKTPLDLVVMELKTKPLSDTMWDILRPAGFIKCSVESIKAPEKTRGDLKEKFAVLHVWAMEVYETVVFLDADTFVQNSIDDLIHMDLKGKPVGVTKDIRERKWVDTFNSGVMVLHPSIIEHKRLVDLLYSGLKFDYIMSDQGFLNEVYKDNWHEIGFINNANLALYLFQRKFWDEHKLEDINIIHYTMQKPWKCRPTGGYGPICKLWINAFAD